MNILFLVAISLGVLSILLSFAAISKSRKARKMLNASLENLRAAEQTREQTSRMINDHPEPYQDLASGSGPKYREYGDLS